MEQELVDYLDRRFAELHEGTRREIVDSAAGLRQEVADSAAGLRREIADSAAGLRQEVAASAMETRRHFDVVGERLRHEIQLLAEGVGAVDQKLEHFRVEVADEFRRVDLRLLRLEARPSG